MSQRLGGADRLSLVAGVLFMLAGVLFLLDALGTWELRIDYLVPSACHRRPGRAGQRLADAPAPVLRVNA